MCRLLGITYVKEPALSLFTAFIRASQHDFIAEECYGFRSHNHGWGLAASTDEGRTLFYKFVIPCWDDEMVKTLLNPRVLGGCGILLLHSRRASAGTPIDSFSAHPFSTMLVDGSNIYVVQNGGLDKEKTYSMLKEKFGLKLEAVSDTLLFTRLLAETYRDMGIEEPSERLLRALKTLYRKLVERGAAGGLANTFILHSLPGDRSYMVAVRFIANETEKALKYGELFTSKNDDLFVIASSTVARLLEEQGYRMAPLKKNGILLVKIEKRGILTHFHVL